MNKDKINHLDSIRGIASIFVLLSHISLVYFIYIHNFDRQTIPKDYNIQSWIHNSPFTFLFSGTSAVYIFFIMSGIVLSASAKKKKYSLVASMISRYFRLALPAALSCCLAFLIYLFVYKLSIPRVVIPINNAVNIEVMDFWNALLEGGLSSIFDLRFANYYNPVLWTMSIEFYCSILIFVAYKTQMPMVSMPILILTLAMFGYQPLLGGICFYIGMIINEKLINYENKGIGIPMLIAGLYFSGAHDTSASYYLFSSVLGKNTYTILNFFGALFIIIGVSLTSIIKSFLSWNIFLRLGQLSFPLYLTHWAMIYFSFNVLCYFNEINNLINSVVIILGSLLLAYGFSYIDRMAIKISSYIKRKGVNNYTLDTSV